MEHGRHMRLDRDPALVPGPEQVLENPADLRLPFPGQV